MQKLAPYGSWKSPITSDMIASQTIGLEQTIIDGSDVYWIESRPAEGGRSVIVRKSPGKDIEDIIPVPFNARTRVHEYGGGAYTVFGRTVFFSNFADQRLYRLDPGSVPRPITPADGRRYADGVIDARRNRMICVCEDHRHPGREATNSIVAVDLDGGEEMRVLAQGYDFYSSSRISPDGRRLAWLAWNRPNMPWDGTELWTGELDEDGTLLRMELVAGGPDESIFQPEWSPDGILHFVSDRTGWSNLYRLQDGHASALTDMQAELSSPQWRFGFSTYAFQSQDRIICTYIENGIWTLALLDTSSLLIDPIKTPFTDISYLVACQDYALFIAGSPDQPTSLVKLELPTGDMEVLRRSSRAEVDVDYISRPESISYPSGEGLAHAFYYRPKNKDYQGLPGERPPLLVISHGGPTGSATSALKLMIQHWTSRGIAVLDVNYGGSTGYGRAYRERLKGKWGIVDVDDCANGALYLAGKGEVDPDRLIIRGGSAGGYTTLAALAFRRTFRAGASYYGVSDLEILARETHKFESRYLDGLVGPYPERIDLYRERSPIHFPEKLSCPVIFFQGTEDKIVPPNQARMMFDALRARGLPTALVEFEGEQHGFRKAENIKRALDAELYFYSRIFNFQAAEHIEPVPIENL